MLEPRARRWAAIESPVIEKTAQSADKICAFDKAVSEPVAFGAGIDGSLDPDESHVDDSWPIATALFARSNPIAQAASRQMFDELELNKLELNKLVLDKPGQGEAWVC